MKVGDTLFVALCSDGTALIVVTPENSTLQNQLLWLLGLVKPLEEQFLLRQLANASAEIDFAARYILDELGIELAETQSDWLDKLIAPFNGKFPSTRDFSELARSSLPHINVLDDPDQVLVAWADQEERLFRRLERVDVGARLQDGFLAGNKADVDGFIAYSLSIQNRRKSRAGYSLEHHMQTLLKARDVRFSRGVTIENKMKPDFLFPGQAEYENSAFPAEKLSMLGVKATLKDRWRQVLAEASRIRHKHLLTLQPAISENQTNQIRSLDLQLVVPTPIQPSYRESQRDWIMSVAEFIKEMQKRQA